jgi:mono/diheme cytochrome c family protein
MRALCVLAGLLFALPAAAGEDSIALKDGPGKDLVEAHCAACHSLDYIEMNAPFLDDKKWEATVKKMVDRMGAPIEAPDAAAITAYLAASYGP